MWGRRVRDVDLLWKSTLRPHKGWSAMGDERDTYEYLGNVHIASTSRTRPLHGNEVEYLCGGRVVGVKES